MRTQWPSPAKLNLFLYITGQRADGYHTLQTLFQFLDYGDTISIELRDDGDIRLLTPVEGVEHEDILIVRAARLLMKTAADSGRLPTGSGADISIDKRLPMGGGLGGGSGGSKGLEGDFPPVWFGSACHGCGWRLEEAAAPWRRWLVVGWMLAVVAVDAEELSLAGVAFARVLEMVEDARMM